MSSRTGVPDLGYAMIDGNGAPGGEALTSAW
jgi:hypothetical protein